MASTIESVCLFLACSLFALSSGRVTGPVVNIPGKSDVRRGPGVNPPSGPGPEILPKVPSGRWGMRCPLATTYEEYRRNCAQYIDQQCGCVYDDMHIGQVDCVLQNRTEYDHLVQMQLDLERERDQFRVQTGGESYAEPYYHALECQQKVPQIIAAHNDQTNKTEAGEGEEEETSEE